ncbi:MAG: CopG family transcriptional regulator [Candidatus Pacearchaeota archaeon]|nr:CopG family transcriptional regulator [Candidatus Pacearchaeota archaeon]
MAEKPIQIKIPYKLAGKLSKKIKETGFDTITEYVLYVLEQTLSEDSENSENYEEEEKNVKERLKDLGYL